MIPYLGALKIKTVLWIASALSLLVFVVDPTVKVALIAATAQILLSLITLSAVLLNRRDTKKGINDVHISLNSRLSELLKTTSESSHAAGRREGIESKDKS